MAVSFGDEGIQFGSTRIEWTTVPQLVLAHLERCPDTMDAELSGAFFLTTPTVDSAVELIHRTCYWGGSNGPRILPMIMRENSGEQLRDSLLAGANALDLGHGVSDLDKALRAVNQISYLGQPSFASKMLRMMKGEWCGVLDSLVADAASYPLERRAFALYSAKLQEIASELSAREIENPRGRANWWAGDVDQAIFAEIRGWR